MSYLILLSALSISAVSAYFSIIGLTTMFPSAFWSIVIMGGVLEIGKLVSASWLHHNWRVAPRSLKIYLTTAVVVLIFITSMGIFGFLSKSHIEHQKSAEKNAILMTQIDDKISREQEYISRQKEYIDQLSTLTDQSSQKSVYNIELEQKKINDLYDSLDKNLAFDVKEIERLNNRRSSLDQELSDLSNSSGGLFSNKNKKIEELNLKQKKEREEIDSKIKAAEDRISKMRESTQSQVDAVRKKIDERQDSPSESEDLDKKREEHNQNIKLAHERIDSMESEKFEYKNAQLNLEAEVGPVKYVAELMEDLGASSIGLAEAVRIVIIILVFVFDPLAVVMLLAANLSFKMRKRGAYENISDRVPVKKKLVTSTTSTTTTSTTTEKPTTTTTSTTTTTTEKPTTTTSTTTTTTEKPTTTTSTTTTKPPSKKKDVTVKGLLKFK